MPGLAARGLRFCWLLVRQVRRVAVVALVLGLIALNVATLTVGWVGAALGGALTAVSGVQTVAEGLRKDRAALERKNRSLDRKARRLSAMQARTRAALRATPSRTARVAARGVLTIPAKATPVVGVAALVSMTAYDLANACALLEELGAAGGDGYLPNEARERSDSHPDEPRGLGRFCLQNRARLNAVQQRLEPLLAPLDPHAEAAWDAAADIIDEAERLADWAPG